MNKRLNGIRIDHPTFLLTYPALQFHPDEMAKPDGSLSLPYLAGALRRSGYAVDILDVSVGKPTDSLADTFLKPTQLSNGLLRCGLPNDRVMSYMEPFDVIGVSSIFTAQTTMALELARTAKNVDPSKLVIAGGVNARNLRRPFFDAGVDIIALSEGENTVLAIAEAVRGRGVMTEIPGIAYCDDDGRERINPALSVVQNLDELPLPAWDLLPLTKYWDLSRPHGGHFPSNQRIQYASMQTSRGCPYQCMYCHISRESDGSASGDIRRLRCKSIDRVLDELQTLKDLGVSHVFLEDDSLFAKKSRAYELFRLVSEMGLQLLDVNGVNICHLLTNHRGRVVVDTEFLEVIARAGFTMLSLPFESASQRIINKYATAKWNIESTDTEAIICSCANLGIMTAGNYMIGYPDETLAEIQGTILMAKEHVQLGMNHAHFFAVVPFPGTALFDLVVTNGQLDPKFCPDDMKWTKSILSGLAVSAEALEQMRQLAWLTVNRAEFVNYKRAMRVSERREGECETREARPLVYAMSASGACDVPLAQTNP